MIQANELRVGNYVASDHFKDRDVIVKVRLIGQEQAIVEHPNGLTEPMLYQCEMRAIKLTEEILLNCGFEDVSTYKDFRLVINEDLYIEVSLRKNINAYVSIFDIDILNVIYLHQLQNLYFALTGKELEVKI
ncbi:hypothetical protein AAW12_08820 [Sphingobacterium sp. Ag1]|uniref:hypothetical protein n=1 Tax=Sphingobacterium sp. Ag1 TaxID=1643451 RepID=UPI000627B2C7|nr:hypothetical protein [Sphingobacterium sp. Ag1]KKO91754.1 hypothetical protein AAW12_08820 [Sphingobacterium sp. Ag1]